MDRELYSNAKYSVVPKPKAENSLQNQMVAMGRALVKAKKNMTLEQRKLLIMALTKIKWTQAENDLVVGISKIDIAEAMGWNVNASDRSTKIRSLAKEMARNSWIELDGEDKESWDDGCLVPRYHSTRGDLYIHFAEQYRPLLEDLTRNKDFVTIWANDVYGFKSVYSYLLFEDLRMNCDTRETNWRTYTTKQLKELFGIPKEGRGSYMHYDAKRGRQVFDRTHFEEKVLDVAIDEVHRSQMVKILPFVGEEATPQRPRKIYQKIKKNGYVAGYQIKYKVNTNQINELLSEHS